MQQRQLPMIRYSRYAREIKGHFDSAKYIRTSKRGTLFGKRQRIELKLSVRGMNRDTGKG